MLRGGSTVETKKSKYDTNPLDPEVERKAEESWGDRAGGGETQQVGGATRQVGDVPPAWTPTPNPDDSARQNVYSEAPTRRYDNPQLEAPYPSVFIPPTYAPPAQYPPPQHPASVYQSPMSFSHPSRPVAGLGLAEKWALMMAYAPYVGIVVSLLELFLVPRKEVKVRFHAAQALALHIAFLAISTIFKLIATVGGGDFGQVIFSIASTVFLVISMIRVWRGEPHSIAPLAEPGKWFNRHIEPRETS
ncbi:MAG TPA: DUF4870 domain-containing protein [Pyrinomonadaceae bacterium]|nr:DUF4870 domain-containing protein [Pyrinomonadaceae bacterium]